MSYGTTNERNSALTPQREVVLAVIRMSKTHPTANEVFAAAKRQLPSISFATVYNSLRYLKEAGHIAEISFGNASSRFDAMTHRHDHALCIECGTLVDIEMDLPSDLMARAAEYSRFEPESIELTLRGKCSTCCGGDLPTSSGVGSYKEKQQSKFSRRSTNRLNK